MTVLHAKKSKLNHEDAKLFLALSLIIHAIIYFWPSHFVSLIPHNSELIVFELQKSVAPLADSSTHKTSSISNKPSARTKNLTLKDLDFSSTAQSFSTKKLQAPIIPNENETSSWTSSDSYITDRIRAFDGMDMGQIRLAQALWHEIDRYIVESPYLSEYNHIGQIHLNFKIDENGNLDEQSLHACGSDRVLKVIALRALRKALRNETAEIPNLHKADSFFAQFSWSDYESCKNLRGTRKNYLSFCHYAENKRKSFSTGEKIGTYLESLNYGFGAIEEIEKYNQEQRRRNTQFDPFIDMQRDPDWNLGC